MKKLPFRKVKIVRDFDEVEYNENAVFHANRGSVPTILSQISTHEWDKACVDRNHEQAYARYNEKYLRKARAYLKTRKDRGKRMALKTSQWKVVDESSGEVIGQFDSIEQAKRYCVKRSYDFGLFG